MKYIQNIDNAANNKLRNPYSKEQHLIPWVIAKPLEGSGLLKWNIRVRKAVAVLRGKADAFTYSLDQ